MVMSSHIHSQAFAGRVLSRRNKIRRAPPPPLLSNLIVRRTALDGAEGGHDDCVCFFRRFKAVYSGGRLNVSEPAFTSSRRDWACILIPGPCLRLGSETKQYPLLDCTEIARGTTQPVNFRSHSMCSNLASGALRPKERLLRYNGFLKT